MSNHDVIFNDTRHDLIDPLECGHTYKKTGKTLVTKRRHDCVMCKRETKGEAQPPVTLHDVTSLPPPAQQPAPDAAPSAPPHQLVSLDQLILDDTDVQPRMRLNRDKITEYAAQYADGAAFDPIIVYQTADALVVADGFHRVTAARQAGLTELPAVVRTGSRRDAMLAAVEANMKHGIPLTREDKHRVVTRFLQDAEWSGWSSRDIARRCGVSHTFVDNVREELCPLTGNVASDERNKTPVRTYRDKHGNVSTMDPSKIGRRAPVPNGADASSNGAEVPQETESALSVNGREHAAGARPGGENGASLAQMMPPLPATYGTFGALLTALQVIADLEQPYDVAMAITPEEAKQIESVVLPAHTNLAEFLRGWEQQRSQCAAAPGIHRATAGEQVGNDRVA